MEIHRQREHRVRLVLTVLDTKANPNEITQRYTLLHEDETIAFIDADNRGVDNCNETTGGEWTVTLRSSKFGAQNKNSLQNNLHNKSAKFQVTVWANVEHLFNVLKSQFRFVKIFHSYLAKKTAPLVIFITFSNF